MITNEGGCPKGAHDYVSFKLSEYHEHGLICDNTFPCYNEEHASIRQQHATKWQQKC